MSVTTTVKVKCCANSDGVNNRQNGGRTHSVRYSDDNSGNNRNGLENVTCKQTVT